MLCTCLLILSHCPMLASHSPLVCAGTLPLCVEANTHRMQPYTHSPPFSPIPGHLIPIPPPPLVPALPVPPSAPLPPAAYAAATFSFCKKAGTGEGAAVVVSDGLAGGAGDSPSPCVLFVCIYVCFCVCVCERERVSERGNGCYGWCNNVHVCACTYVARWIRTSCARIHIHTAPHTQHHTHSTTHTALPNTAPYTQHTPQFSFFSRQAAMVWTQSDQQGYHWAPH